METSVSRRQLLALGTMIFLVPVLRLYPAQTAALAGRAAWVAAPLALPLMLGYVFFLTRLMALREEGEGLAELGLRLLGRVPGRIFLLLAAGWTLLYAAFVLRSGADRLVGTVYLKANPAVFTEVMGLLGILAALAAPLVLTRMARMVQPFLLGVLLLLLGAALFSAKADHLLPLTGRDLLPAARGAAVAVDVLSYPAAALCFLAGSVKKRPGAFRALGLWMVVLIALLTLLDLAMLGRFGAELVASLSRPFFVLVRTLVFFRTVERVEALVVMLWIFPDFLLAALTLRSGAQAVKLLLKSGKWGERLFSALPQGEKLLTWVCGTAVILLALFLAPDSRSLEHWSTVVIPALNLLFCFGLLPLLYIVGSRRGREAAPPP